MRKLFVFASFFLSAISAKSQNLTVEGIAPNLYISHTVAPKENFYSIGRLYNQAPKTIASFNNIVMEKGLSIGQHIKVPLNAQNFDATGKAVAGENLVPLAHVVAKGENLFKIGTEHSVTAVSLRQWNNLSNDNIVVGAPLVVGHLKIKSGESNVQQTAKANTAAPAPQPKNNPAPIVKEEAIVVAAPTPAPAKDKEKKDDNTFTSIEVKKPNEPVTPKAETNQEPVKPAPVAKPEPVKPEPVKESAKETPKDYPAKQQEPQQTRREEPRKDERKKIDISTTTASSAEGAFASIFANDLTKRSINTKNGEAATFKSNSGWQDRKYYVLINDIAPGTILKLTSGNSKVVYAKVLGSMPEMKENNGLLLRISNAAASYLGILDAKFNVEISYYQ